MYKNNKIILILPALNEEGKIGKVIEKVPKGLIDEILVINDGSTDNTEKEAKAGGATVISFKKNRGLGIAFKTAFRYSLEKEYDIVAIIGGDNQDDPREIYKFLEAIVDENYDLAQGTRYWGKPIKIPLFRRITTISYSLLFSIVSGKRIKDASNGYKVFKLPILKKINLNKKWIDARYGIEQHILIQSIKKGFKVKEIPVKKFFPTLEGYTKMRILIDWYLMLQPIIRNIW